MRKAALMAIALGAIVITAQHAQARDFISMFDNMFGGNATSEPSPRRSFAPSYPFGEPDEPRRAAPAYSSGGRSASGGGSSGGGGYCVRTCDGRYFPLASTGGQSKAQACNSFCPASETKVVYGSSIDNAVTDGGKAYSDLPNAFRYRTELVNGCSCNGKNPVGLADVKIEDDKTVRRGDIVAGPNGLLVAGRSADTNRRASVQFSPASKSVQDRFSRLPVVAAQ